MLMAFNRCVYFFHHPPGDPGMEWRWAKVL